MKCLKCGEVLYNILQDIRISGVENWKKALNNILRKVREHIRLYSQAY